MKKISGFILILILVLILAGCSGGTESTRTFVLDKDGIKTTMVYTFKGDKVTKQSTENIINYELVGIPSKEEAKLFFDPLIEEFNKYDGITHKMDYYDKEANENLTLDYEIVDFQEIKNLPGMTFDDDVGKAGISMKKSAALLESQGFTEVK